MIETILSIIVIILFSAGFVYLFNLKPSPKLKNIDLPETFSADCSNSCEDSNVIFERALASNVAKPNFLGHKNGR